MIFDWVYGLSILGVVFSLPLIILSLMAVGKHYADLQYQKIARINGIRYIQSWTNLRTHFNRVAFGGAFFIISILIIFDVDIATRTIISRFLLIGVLALYLISSILDFFAEHKQLKIILDYEEINKLPVIRVLLHSLNGQLSILYGLIFELNKNKTQEEEIDAIQIQIKEALREIQQNVHSMDPTYVRRKDAPEINRSVGTDDTQDIKT